MKINKKQIDMIMSLPDDALRHVIKTVGASSGFDLSGISMSGSDLDRIRSLLRGMNEEDVSRAAEIMKNFNKN